MLRRGESPIHDDDISRFLAEGDLDLTFTTDAEEAVRLHAAMTGAAEKLSASEERWLALQEELGSFE